MRPSGTSSDWWIPVLAWTIRHWFLVLILVGVIYAIVHVSESEHPRPGYVDTGETLTEQECRDQGGMLVDDVCYLP